MSTHAVSRTAGILVMGLVFVLLAGGILSWQAGAEDVTNPRANFWRVVREGVAGFTEVASPAHKVLIQNGGENWREIRNGLLVRFSPWVILLMLAALALFYRFVGPEKLDKPRSGLRIERYSLLERILHWYTAVAFIIMALTGLSLLLVRAILLPILGHPAVSVWLQAAKVLHNYCGPLLVVGLALEVVLWMRFNIPEKVDLQWFKSMGGMLGHGPRPHAGKVNGGQKAWFWAVCLFGIAVGSTGIVLDFPIWNQTRLVMQVSQVIHATVAVLFVTASCVHIYMGTVGTEGGFESMWAGSVDVVWAQQHSDLWYEETRRRGEGEPMVSSPQQA
jgi:formate dehydrogenase subunit gamma